MLNKRTLNDFFNTENNVLISNNYSAFDTNILEIRLMTLYGERPLRPFSDSHIKAIAQNVVDMYSGYLNEIFNFPKEYSILTPELKEIIRQMNYSKTNDDKTTNTATESGENHGTTNGTGSHNDTITSTGTDSHTLKNDTITNYGKMIDGTNSSTGTESGWDVSNDTATHTGTANTVASGDNGDTLTKSVSATNEPNQTDPTYSPREQDATVGNTSSDSTLTNDLKDVADHDGSYKKNLTNSGENKTAESGSDTTNFNGTDNLTKDSKTTNIGSSNDSSTTSGTQSRDSSANGTFVGNESYDMSETVTEKGRLSYEEILQTFENLFNPYDWLATKITNSICEVMYNERIK